VPRSARPVVLSAQTRELGVAIEMLLTKAEQVLDDGAPSAYGGTPPARLLCSTASCRVVRPHLRAPSALTPRAAKISRARAS
jgi:hypothetical protein